MNTQQSLEGLVHEWRELAKKLDDQVGRAAALHNLTEYGRLRIRRNTLEECAKELHALIHGDERP